MRSWKRSGKLAYLATFGLDQIEVFRILVKDFMKRLDPARDNWLKQMKGMKPSFESWKGSESELQIFTLNLDSSLNLSLTQWRITGKSWITGGEIMVDY